MVIQHIIFDTHPNADVAQPVEQLIRNQQVSGSIPLVGSNKIINKSSKLYL
jgi:hypothetical protein